MEPNLGPTSGRASTFSLFLRELAHVSSVAPVADRAPPLPIGLELGGRFELRRLIGRGGMGYVYEAFDRRLAMSVALKTLSAVRAERRILLKHEFRLLDSVHHPNLVRPGELLSDGEHWFFTMELIEGVDPVAWSSRREERVRVLFRELASVLSAMHEKGVVHGDVKPSNVIVTSDGHVVLVDLGLARMESNPSWFDYAGGTPPYMAPEQRAGAAASPAADVYGLGVLAFECLTGKRPDGEGSAAGRELSMLRPELEPALAEVCADALSADPRERPSAAELTARLRHEGPWLEAEPAPRSNSAEIVGRDSELSRLAGAFELLLGGASAAVFVEGPSGIGKSTLVAAFLDGIAGRTDAMVLKGRCHKSESLPFKALDGVVDALAAELSRTPELLATIDGSDLAVLARTFPSLALIDGASLKSARALAAEGRKLVFEAFRRVVANVACRRKLVIFLDDVQWADSDGLDLLREALAPPFPGAVLVIGTSRQGPPPAFSSLPAFAHLELSPLDAEHCETLARRLLPAGAGTLEAAIRKAIDESRGHPLHLRELIVYQQDCGSPAASLDQAILARIARLSAEARRLLEFVAVAGSPLLHEALRALWASDSESLQKELRRLEIELIVVACPTGQTQALDTGHDRIRESVLTSLSSERIAELHRCLAEVLTAVAPDETAELAIHWHAAGDHERALPCCLDAVGKAREKSAFGQAADLLSLAASMAPASERNGLRAQHAEALAAAFRPLDCAEVLLALSEDEPKQRTALKLRAAQHLFIGGAIERALELQRSLLTAIGVPQRGLVVLIATLLRLGLMQLVHRFPGLARWLTRSHAPHEIDVLYSAASALSMVDVVLALRYHSHALVAAYRSNDALRIARSLAIEACVKGSLTRFSVAEALIAMIEKLIDASDEGEGMVMLRGARCVVKLQRGQWDSSLLELETLDGQPLMRSQNSWHNMVRNVYGATNEYNRGRLGAMQRRCDSVLGEAARRDDRLMQASLGVSFGPLACLVRDDFAAARTMARRSREMLWGSGPGGYLQTLATMAAMSVELYARRYQVALDALRQRSVGEAMISTRSHYTRVHITFLEASARLGLLRERGLSRRLRSAVARSARALERDMVPWASAYAALLEAELAHLENRPNDADAQLDRAIARFERFQCDHMIAICRAARSDRSPGSAGTALDYLRKEGVVKPLSFVHMLVPAFF